MTRKDYQRLADALGEAWKRCDTMAVLPDELMSRRVGVDEAAKAITDALAAENYAFDHSRFTDAYFLARQKTR